MLPPNPLQKPEAGWGRMFMLFPPDHKKTILAPDTRRRQVYDHPSFGSLRKSKKGCYVPVNRDNCVPGETEAGMRRGNHAEG